VRQTQTPENAALEARRLHNVAKTNKTIAIVQRVLNAIQAVCTAILACL
jgi:hypothetical protein